MKLFEVPATELIDKVAIDLEKKFKIEKPAFIAFVKTGSNRERAPQNENWYYVRMASILYRIAKEGNLGVGSLRTYYGGRKNRGVKPHRFRKASGKIIRTALQALEGVELVKKEKKGRVITPKGLKYLNQKASELLQNQKLKTEKEKTVERGIKEKPSSESSEAEKHKAKPAKGHVTGKNSKKVN